MSIHPFTEVSCIVFSCFILGYTKSCCLIMLTPGGGKETNNEKPSGRQFWLSGKVAARYEFVSQMTASEFEYQHNQAPKIFSSLDGVSSFLLFL